MADTTIRLKITKYRATTPEEIEQAIQNYRDSRMPGYSHMERPDIPTEKVTDVLDVVITEAQFEAIRKAVIEKF